MKRFSPNMAEEKTKKEFFGMLPSVRPERIFGPTNTEHFVLDWLVTNYGRVPFPSPLLEPRVCQRMLYDFHAARSRADGKNYQYSWGDYGAWRENMWNGFYGHTESRYRHLGIDVNARSVPVCVDHDCTVVLIDTDHNDSSPEPQGWGRRVVVYVPECSIYLLYAHLAPRVRCVVGEKLKPGTVIGHVGHPTHNGQWYSHCHVQAVVPKAWEYFYPHHLNLLDGYCTPQQWPLMSKVCPDPRPYVQIP